MEKITYFNSIVKSEKNNIVEEDYIGKEVVSFLEDFLNKSLYDERLSCRVRTNNCYIEISRSIRNPKNHRLFMKFSYSEIKEINNELHYKIVSKNITSNQRYILNHEKEHEIFKSKEYISLKNELKKVQNSYEIKEYECNTNFLKFIENKKDIKFHIEEVKRVLNIDKDVIRENLKNLYSREILLINKIVKD